MVAESTAIRSTSKTTKTLPAFAAVSKELSMYAIMLLGRNNVRGTLSNGEQVNPQGPTGHIFAVNCQCIFSARPEPQASHLLLASQSACHACSLNSSRPISIRRISDLHGAPSKQ